MLFLKRIFLKVLIFGNVAHFLEISAHIKAGDVRNNVLNFGVEIMIITVPITINSKNFYWPTRYNETSYIYKLPSPESAKDHGIVHFENDMK